MADTTRKDRATKASVASHPLFPAVVVVWFGALFGLASLAIRPALIEGLVSATGIDQIIPMAAPPLGTTTRILIALMMTLLGCVAGAIVARRFARPAVQKVSSRRRRPATIAKAEDEPSPVALFGADASKPADEADEDLPGRRRRQLAIMDASESFDDHAPLPGSTQILSVAELPLKSFDEVDGIWLHNSVRAEPRTEDAVAEQQEAGMSEATERFGTFEPALPATITTSGDDETAEEADLDGRSNRLFESYVRRVNAGVGSNDSDLPAPGFVSVPDAAAQVATSEDAASVVDAPASDSRIEAEPIADAAYANTAERIAAAPLDTLSHVELLERLALTIARRRREAAQRSHAPVIPASAEPVWFSSPQTVAASGEMPAALRPHWMDAEEDDDDALPAMVAPRAMTMTSKLVADDTADGTAPDALLQKKAVLQEEAAHQDDPHLLAQGYSSLLGMTKPGLRQVFGRSDPADAAPVPTASTSRAFDAPQPGEALPDQTEQALRAALATLRRMSGAA